METIHNDIDESNSYLWSVIVMLYWITLSLFRRINWTVDVPSLSKYDDKIVNLYLNSNWRPPAHLLLAISKILLHKTIELGNLDPILILLILHPNKKILYSCLGLNKKIGCKNSYFRVGSKRLLFIPVVSVLCQKWRFLNK